MRPATPADLPAITALWAAVDTHWFGAPELDEGEVAEQLSLAADDHRFVVDDEGGLAGAFWWNGPDTTLLVRPGADDVRRQLLDRIVALDVPQVQTLAVDDALRNQLERRGWRHGHSSFELLRPVTPDWTLAEPRRPAGVELRPTVSHDLATLHRLVYVDAAWTDVVGHVERPFAQWCMIFVPTPESLAQHVVAWRDGRPVGLALRRIFSDGTGWIPQLAVARDARRLGLGRALLLEALRRHRDQGVVTLGLGVEAANVHALDLYVGAGLRVDREWQTYVRPTRDS